MTAAVGYSRRSHADGPNEVVCLAAWSLTVRTPLAPISMVASRNCSTPWLVCTRHSIPATLAPAATALRANAPFGPAVQHDAARPGPLGVAAPPAGRLGAPRGRLDHPGRQRDRPAHGGQVRVR